MQDNKKRGLVLKGLLLLLVVAILGFAGWRILSRGKTLTINNSGTAACSVTLQNNDTSSFQLPNGWNWYQTEEGKVKYAYPESWLSPTNQTNSGGQKYVASFTVSPSGANIVLTLSPDCADFQTPLSDINSGTADTADNSITTKLINHSETAYSTLSHWSSDEGNHYQLTTYNLVSVGTIKSVVVEYSLISGPEVCPDEKLAPTTQPSCITQSISDEIDKVINSLQKL